MSTDKIEVYLYNSIICLFDNCIDSWKSIDDPDWIDFVCTQLGMTKEEYMELMFD